MSRRVWLFIVAAMAAVALGTTLAVIAKAVILLIK